MSQTAFLPRADADQLHALLVEDDESLNKVMSRQLEQMGCTVRSAQNASGFFAELIQVDSHFDLAIVDLQLPGLAGDKIISWLRESERSTLRQLPILIVTGFPQLARDMLLEENINAEVVSKPYRYDDLKAAVARIVSKGQLH